MGEIGESGETSQQPLPTNLGDTTAEEEIVVVIEERGEDESRVRGELSAEGGKSGGRGGFSEGGILTPSVGVLRRDRKRPRGGR